MKDRFVTCAIHSLERSLVSQRRTPRGGGSADWNVTKLMNSVHTLFTPDDPLLSASGVRLETLEKTDKQKSELYFSTPHKNFLTEKNRFNVADFSLVRTVSAVPNFKTSTQF